MKFVIDNKIPFIKQVLEPYADVVYLTGSDINRDHLLDSDGLIIRTRTSVQRDLLEGTGVKFVGTTTIGTDHIDTQWCDDNNITWRHAPGSNSKSVMQYVAASLAYLQNRYRFEPAKLTIGIIGVGNIGSKVASLAKLLGYKVLLNDPPRSRREGKHGFTEIDLLVEKSDIITLHVPLQLAGRDKTSQMINHHLLNRVKKEAILINTSRGQVICEEDLIKCLRDGGIKTAIIDVWENEPLINRDLLGQVTLGTPHIAGYSLEGKANATSMIIRQISNIFNLPLYNWSPKIIPGPNKPEIDIYQEDLGENDIINRSILATYPIEKDSSRLKQSPDKFEDLRSSYWNRREFEAYKINSDNKNALNKLRGVGFNL